MNPEERLRAYIRARLTDGRNPKRTGGRKSSKEWAETLGIKPSQFSEWMSTGAKAPAISDLDKFAKEFRTTIGRMLEPAPADAAPENPYVPDLLDAFLQLPADTQGKIVEQVAFILKAKKAHDAAVAASMRNTLATDERAHTASTAPPEKEPRSQPRDEAAEPHENPRRRRRRG